MPETQPWPPEEVVQELTVHLLPPFPYLTSIDKLTRTGWGEYISSISGTVSNKALGGRSARSYTREGHFEEIASTLQKGDYVVIEFGHNDGGSLSSGEDNGRTDCPGTGK